MIQKLSLLVLGNLFYTCKTPQSIPKYHRKKYNRNNLIEIMRLKNKKASTILCMRTTECVSRQTKLPIDKRLNTDCA